MSTAQPAWVMSGEERRPNASDSTGDSDDVTVRFSNGVAYRIPLYRAKAVGVLRGSDGTPFLLAAGADCTLCDEGTTLRFFMLGEEQLQGSGARYSYPGSLSAATAAGTEVAVGTVTENAQCTELPGIDGHIEP